MVEEVDQKKLDELVKSKKKVVVDLWAPWCPPCRKASRVVEELSEEVEGVEFVKVNIDENRDVVEKFGLKAIPTFIIFSEGEEKGRIVGAKDKEVLREALK